MKTNLIASAAVFGFGMSLLAAPLTPEQLQLRAILDFGADLGSANSMFNPVYTGDKVVVNQINIGFQGFGIYPSGWGTPQMIKDNRGVTEHRMVMPFKGTLSSKYLIASSSGAAPTTTAFFRYDIDGNNVVSAESPGGQIVEGFDMVDENTIIHTSYTSGNRTRLYLVHVTAEPFALSADTRWNANGYIVTGAANRIRNVRVGDLYKDYAYYGNNGLNNNPNFYALHINTGVETVLGNAGTLTGTGSFGIWTVMERGGYLYVQTTDNGVQVYQMNSATSLGPLYATYTKEQLDAITGRTTQYFGFDVVPDGSRFVLGGAAGQVYEFGGPELNISSDSTGVFLRWTFGVNAVALQSTSTLAPGSFADMNPQPGVVADGKTNFVQIIPGAGNEFFRLRRNP